MDETPKRKNRTSTQVKDRYNKKVYTQLNVKVPKETAVKFKTKCDTECVPMAQVFKKAIDDFLNEQYKKGREE